jgi:hypothetical protein
MILSAMKAIDLAERTGQIVEMAQVDFARNQRLLSPLESGTVLSVAAQFSPFGDSLGIQGK